MQEISVIGRLGKNAQVHETKNGRKFVSFTMAVNTKRNNETKTSWYEVISFNEQHVNKLTQYLTKGSLLVVVGELDAEAQLGKDGKAYIRLSIIADRIDFISTGNGENSSNSVNSVAERYSEDEVTMVVDKDSIPAPKTEVPKPIINTAASIDTAASIEVEDDLPF